MNLISQIRNIGIIAHIDAGKTTLSERILFYTQKIHRMGEVHNGTATMDYLPEEQERGITITSACTTCAWDWENQTMNINIIDTPGHVDFTIEVERSLRVLDGAVGVFCAVGGVEPQSETVWKQSENFKVPKLAFINKIDRQGADFEAVLSSMHKRLGIQTLLLNMPLGSEENVQGIIDLVNNELISFDHTTQGQQIETRPLNEQEEKLAQPWRTMLLESLAESDEIFFEQYLQENFTLSNVQAAIRRVCLKRLCVPVLVGSALRNIGVQPLLDAICAYLPSPLEAEPALASALDSAQGEQIMIEPDPKAELMALVFKVLMEGGRKLCFARIYAGTLKEGTYYNRSRKIEERILRIYRLHADRKEQISSAGTGEIVALIGLRQSTTGDTISSSNQPYILETLNNYAPVISLALEPHNADEGKILDEAVQRFILEDPTLNASIDEGSGHRILSGMGELHLDVIIERIRREYNISPRVGNPQVIKRESITKSAQAEGLFERELGEQSHHGHLSLNLSPLPRHSGNNINFACDLSKIPLALVQAAKQGLEDALLCGPLTGYPLQDIEITITAMNKKEGASTIPGFTMAAGQAMRLALEQAKPVALEPIMFVEIIVPDEGLGSAISLFNSRGGKIENLLDRGGQKCLQGLAPLAKLFGFSTALRSATQGRAGLLMRFEHFDSL